MFSLLNSRVRTSPGPSLACLFCFLQVRCRHACRPLSSSASLCLLGACGKLRCGIYMRLCTSHSYCISLPYGRRKDSSCTNIPVLNFSFASSYSYRQIHHVQTYRPLYTCIIANYATIVQCTTDIPACSASSQQQHVLPDEAMGW